jgi:predicted RNase H-like HicB family nuclease
MAAGQYRSARWSVNPGALGGARVRQIKIVVEKHTDGYVAYPLGIKGVVVGEGETYEEALRDVRSALGFHLETFGSDSSRSTHRSSRQFVAEAAVGS